MFFSLLFDFMKVKIVLENDFKSSRDTYFHFIRRLGHPEKRIMTKANNEQLPATFTLPRHYSLSVYSKHFLFLPKTYAPGGASGGRTLSNSGKREINHCQLNLMEVSVENLMMSLDARFDRVMDAQNVMAVKH